MSVPKSNSEIENDLSTLEAETMQQLAVEGKAGGEAPKGDEQPDQHQTQTEGERETPESAPTTDQPTTDTTTKGGESKPEGDITDTGASTGEDEPTKPEGEGDGSQPSEKAKSRQHELAQKLKAQTEENKRLQKLLATQRTAKSKSGTGTGSKLPWDQDNDGEITPEEIEQNIDARAEAIVEHKFFVREALQNFQSDLTELEKNPELNPDNDAFDQELVDFISENYKIRLAQNPALRLKDYAGRIIELRRSAAERSARAAATETTNNIRRRAATQPITGGGQSATQRTVDDMMSGAKTIEELDAIAEKNLPVSSS